jgi:hypothetical protein
LRVEPYARRLWTCHRMWAPPRPASCGVFLYELGPSDDPFMLCLCETIFLRPFFFPTDFLLAPPKDVLSSQRVLQLLPYKVSPIRTSAYTC